MREMDRIVMPGGFLILSTHGEACIGPLGTEQQRRFRSGEAVVKDEASAGTNRCGVYLPEEYVRTRLAGPFRLVDFRPQGARGNPPQDLALFQKPSPAGACRGAPPSTAVGTTDRH
jgi:hypothetical protein